MSLSKKVKFNYLPLARKAIRIEKEGLVQLEKKLTSVFNLVINEIRGCRGKMVFTGVGKAGLVAQKIASTFSSLGQASFFMHPSEAAHGDLGMIVNNDLVFLFSNSGESKEITLLVNPIKKIGAKLIAITSNQNSFLGRYSDFVLLIGNSPEACSLGLAPTTSTTVMMVLGDALAVSLVESDKRFNHNSFAANHPGGSLGLRLMYVQEIMRKNKEVAVVSSNTMISQALLKMTEARIGVVVILNPANSSLRGIFSDGDLRRLLAKKNYQLNDVIKKNMNKQPIFILENQYVGEAQKIMLEKKIGELPVLNRKKKFLGVICLKDINL